MPTPLPRARSAPTLLGGVEILVGRLLRGERPVYEILFALCAVATVAPLWVAPILPFQDYAGNLSYAAILAGASTPPDLYARVFDVGGLLVPNGLFLYSWAWLGSTPLGFVVAGKILLSVYAIALPWSVDRLLAAAGRQRAFTLLSFPLVYNSNLVMGFASFATALPLLIYCFARALRFHDRADLRSGVAVAALAMLTFLGHAQMYLILGVVALAFVFVAATSLRRFLLLAAPFAVSLLLFLPWAWDAFVDPADKTALGGQDLKPFFQEPIDLFGRFGELSIGRWADGFDDWAFLGTLGLIAFGLIHRRPVPGPDGRPRRYVVEAATLLVAFTYLVIPEHTQVQAAIGSRLVSVVMLLVVGWLFLPRARWTHGPIMAAMTALTLYYASHTATAIEDFNERETGPGFIELVDSVPDGSRLAFIAEDRGSSLTRVHSHAHMYGYHFALNGGLAYSTFHSFHGRHAEWRAGHQVPFPGQDARSFLRSKAACWYDFLLVRTHKQPRWRQLASRLTYAGHSRRYSLWRIEKDRISACSKRKKKKSPEKKPDGAAPPTPPRVPVAGPPGPLPSTLAPRVGHARGRALDGSWRPSDRAQPGAELPPAVRAQAPRLVAPDLRPPKLTTTPPTRGEERR